MQGPPAMQETRLAILRQLPSVDGLAQSCQQGNGTGRPPPALLLEAARGVLERKRHQILSASSPEVLAEIDLRAETLQGEVAEWLNRARQPQFRRLINATGVILHTNLGRALLSRTAVEQVAMLAAHYSNLEYDLERGQRG